MSKYVYLAGPISGCSFKEATDWRVAVNKEFAPGIKSVSPMRLKDWCQRFDVIQNIEQHRYLTCDEEYLISGESHAVRTRDHYDVCAADMVFVYLPQELNERCPSWGTAIEIGWASVHHKPVVLVTDDEHLAAHPLVRESVGWIVPTLSLGVAVVNSVLEVYTA